MKIIFFGTSSFAVSALKTLASSRHQLLAVVTAADKRKGRGRILSSSPVKVFAQKRRLALSQPSNLQDTAFVRFLKNKGADLFVVCAYGKILTKEILQIPRTYAVNLHASLLPKHRGAAPVNSAMSKGDKESGVTVFKMDEQMDRGEIILQKRIIIGNSDTAVSLGAKLSKIGAELALEAIDMIERGRATLTVQDERGATTAPKLRKTDGLINWKEQAAQIHNRIRGLQPWPGAFTYLDNKILKIWGSQVVQGEQDAEIGEVVQVDKRGLLIKTGQGQLLLTVVQLEGKQKMSSAKFILGHRVVAGTKLGKERK